MMRRFLFWLSARLPLRIIDDNGQPYLERYYIASLLGVRVYLHRFVASDPDRGLHDHPWAWAVSLILAGWYIEETRSGGFARNRINFLVGDNFHRVVLPIDGQDVWTIFIHRQGRAKAWGFIREFPNQHTLLWHEYAYTNGTQGEEKQWWVTYPKGRDEPRRLPA